MERLFPFFAVETGQFAGSLVKSHLVAVHGPGDSVAAVTRSVGDRQEMWRQKGDKGESVARTRNSHGKALVEQFDPTFVWLPSKCLEIPHLQSNRKLK